MQEYCPVRLEYYKRRKENILCRLRREREVLFQKKRFILQVISNELEIRNKKRNLILQDLINKGYLTRTQIDQKYKDVYGSKSNPLA